MYLNFDLNYTYRMDKIKMTMKKNNDHIIFTCTQDKKEDTLNTKSGVFTIEHTDEPYKCKLDLAQND